MTLSTTMRRIAAVATALVAVTTYTSQTTVSAAPTWAPEGQATIKPGVQMYTEGAQCTANFVFTDAADNVYVGYAAHCAGLGEATETNGCLADTLPLGTKVTFNTGGSLISSGRQVGTGTLAYSSWVAMHRNGETNTNVCEYNDFALVKVDAGSLGKVNPTVPYFGGPNALATSGTTIGEQVYSYGNSSLRAGLTQLSPKYGTSIGDAGNGWSHTVYTASPGVPGDSGSGFLDSEGNALGTLSTLALAPAPLSNGVSNLSRELSYARTHSGITGLTLVPGTRPFSSSL